MPVPKGEHFLLLQFEDTPARTIGTTLSVLSVAAMLLWAGWVAARRFREAVRR